MKPKLVMITWKDAFEGPSGWITYCDYKVEPVVPVTVGWLFPEDTKVEGYTTVYSTYFGEDDELVVADPNHIPNEMIVNIKHLSV